MINQKKCISRLRKENKYQKTWLQYFKNSSWTLSSQNLKLTKENEKLRKEIFRLSTETEDENSNDEDMGYSANTDIDILDL